MFKSLLLQLLFVVSVYPQTLDYFQSHLYKVPVPEKCSEILKTFATSASNFTLCSVQNTRPITMCENCIEHYLEFRKSYKELSDTVINGTSCLTIFVSSDRFEIVLKYHVNILDIWDRGKCNTCYDWSTGVPVVSNATKRFDILHNNTMECMITNHKLNNSEICEKCMQLYLDLDNFYMSMSDDATGVDSICMDIVDSMNTTRFIWSKTLNCCQLRRTPEIIFLACTGSIAMLPILFYLAVRFCGPIKDLPNVLKQSRFKQKFLRKSFN